MQSVKRSLIGHFHFKEHRFRHKATISSQPALRIFLPGGFSGEPSVNVCRQPVLNGHVPSLQSFSHCLKIPIKKSNCYNLKILTSFLLSWWHKTTTLKIQVCLISPKRTLLPIRQCCEQSQSPFPRRNHHGRWNSLKTLRRSSRIKWIVFDAEKRWTTWSAP